MPKIDPMTRRGFLAGSGIAAGEILLMGGSALASPIVVVSEPTGQAIQAAINQLPATGGTIHLSAKVPYAIKKPIVLNKNNINIIGRGSDVTRLLAHSGATLTVPYHAGEFLLLVQNATNTTIHGLTVDAANQANSPGNSRVGIGTWSSNSVLVSQVAFVNNLGPHGPQNQALSFNQSSGVTADRCDIVQSRTGIFVWQCTNFVLSDCSVQDCEVQPPNYPGPIGAIGITSSTTGSITSCSLYRNTVYGGIFVVDGAHLEISSCKVYDTLPFPTQPGNDGIIIELSTRGPVTVQGCEVVRNSGAGVSSDRSSGVTIKQCTIVNSGTLAAGGSGVSINGGTKNIKVMGNQISDNRSPWYGGIVAGFTGLSPQADSDGHISNNVVHGFAQGVALGSKSNGFQVADNNLRLNKMCFLNLGTHNKITGNECS